MFDKIEGNMLQNRQVFRRMVFVNTVVVLVEAL